MEILELAKGVGMGPADAALLWFLWRLNGSLCGLRHSLYRLGERVAALEGAKA
ncbi:hypothetical protein [Ferrimonas balearica]|uniref:hypothetical protein n=1 Tax=Ferrimonas balearica TaxID=44012 RepID=UPI001F279466|nr:hypothetical protein [Ferrimonas balearica]MBY6095119.1 hypothetical protein [Ferrimonas balearica]